MTDHIQLKKKALIHSQNSSEALNTLYVFGKKEKNSLSLMNICKRSGISSTGYLSDVLKGKRKLHIKYTTGTLKAFNLKGQERKFVELLITRDSSKSSEAINIYNDQIEKVRKSILIKTECLESTEDNWFTLCQVYTTLGIFPDGATENDIDIFLNDLKKKEILDCLKKLLRKKYINKLDNKYFWTKKHFILEGPAKNGLHNQYFKKALQKCMSLIPNRYGDRTNNLFMSQIISVKMSDYQPILERFRSTLLEFQSEMESETANNLVYFNILVTSHHTKSVT